MITIFQIYIVFINNPLYKYMYGNFINSDDPKIHYIHMFHTLNNIIYTYIFIYIYSVLALSSSGHGMKYLLQLVGYISLE